MNLGGVEIAALELDPGEERVGGANELVGATVEIVPVPQPVYALVLEDESTEDAG